MKPTIPDVVERFARYYIQPRNSTWGSLHIVLGDSNLQNVHVVSCYEYALERNDIEGAELACILLAMSKPQRGRLYDKVDLFIREKGWATQTI